MALRKSHGAVEHPSRVYEKEFRHGKATINSWVLCRGWTLLWAGLRNWAHRKTYQQRTFFIVIASQSSYF